MTRFDADAPTERRKLFAAAVGAHRERGSPFLTIEPEPTPAEEAAMAAEGEDEDGNEEDADLSEAAPERSVPWIQFAEQTVNLDCADEELDRLTDLLNDYPEFRIDEMERPEDAHGTNVRITARADANRLAGFFDQVFQRVYGRDEGYRAWIVEI